MSTLWWKIKDTHYYIRFKWPGDNVKWLPGIGWGTVRRNTGECDRSSDRKKAGSTPVAASTASIHKAFREGASIAELQDRWSKLPCEYCGHPTVVYPPVHPKNHYSACSNQNPLVKERPMT